MPFFSKLPLLAFTVPFLLVACGEAPRAPESPRTSVEVREDEFLYETHENDSEIYVDYASKNIGACEWQQRLEKQYISSTRTGRFRLFGDITMRAPPKEDSNPFSAVGQLLSVVDFVLPWNIFRGIDIPNMKIRPWGRIDFRAHSLNSYAFLSEAEQEIPDRKAFLKKVDQALAARPSQYPKLVLFKIGLMTGKINAIEKRNEVVSEEIEKVFPGLFSPTGTRDLLESFSWVLARNGLRQTKDFRSDDLAVYGRKIPVFRAGAWQSFADDMRLGLGAAISAYSSSSARERACAANIIFRSTDQLLHLMGQETLPIVETSGAQSYVPSLEGLLTARDSTTIRRCNSVGSLLSGGKRVRMNESTLANLSKVSEKYQWTESPLPLVYCNPNQTHGSSVAPTANGATTKLDALLSRMDAFGHYLFAFNPNALWWKHSSTYPLGNFNGLKDIQKSLSLAPMRAHALALAFLQLNLLHFENQHLVFLTEDGLRTFDQDEAYAIRIADSPLKSDSPIAKTSLPSALKFLSLLSKFDRYLRSIEAWATSSKASAERVNGLFASRENLHTLIGTGDDRTRIKIERLYLATSLLLLKYVDRDDPSSCHRLLVTELATGEEEVLDDCAELRSELAAAFRKLAPKINSPLLQRSADALDPRP